MFQGVSADIESSMWENIKNNKEDIDTLLMTYQRKKQKRKK